MMHLGWGVHLPDPPRSALTTVLHITPGKYEFSQLKFVIVMWGCLGVFQGCLTEEGVTSEMTVPC